MILDITRLQALHDALIAAHREPQSCGHPKIRRRGCTFSSVCPVGLTLRLRGAVA
jgi:hypothetical protein